MTKFFTRIRALVVVLLASSAALAVNAETLYLRTSSNPDVALELGSINQITFGDQDVTIDLADGSKIECSISDFRSLRTSTAGTPGQSAVEGIIADSDEQWTIYDLKGNLIGTADQIAKVNTSLSSNLSAGVYILKSQSRTIKLIVR